MSDHIPGFLNVGRRHLAEELERQQLTARIPAVDGEPLDHGRRSGAVVIPALDGGAAAARESSVDPADVPELDRLDADPDPGGGTAAAVSR